MSQVLTYLQYLPDMALRLWVHSVWRIHGSCSEAAPQQILPDGCMSLVLNFGPPLERLQPNGVLLRQPKTLVIGEVRRPVALQSTGEVDLIGVRFWPGALRNFVDAPPAALVDALSDESPLCRPLARRIEHTVLSAEPVHRLRLLQLALAEQVVQRMPSHGDMLDAAVRALWQRDGRVPIDAWAASFGVSRRCLERRFARAVGVPPKALADVLRFRRVLRAVAAQSVHGVPDWTGIALDCGYCDQSHMVRHFKRFTGAVPSTFQHACDENYALTLRREAAGFGPES
jgi:AraC-like DNA-binding protein